VFWSLILVLGIAGVVWQFLPHHTPSEWLNPVVAVVSAVFTVLTVIIAVPSRPPPAERPSTPEQLDAAAQHLAPEVLRLWREEVDRRGLASGPPLTVRWSATGLPVADKASQVAEAVAGRAGAGRVVRLRLSGRVDRVVEEFRRLAVPRVVVLGAPGAGKTSLLALLAVGLLEDASRTGPVPVPLTLSSWDPAVEDLYVWMARRLTEDYVGLGNVRAYGGSAARELLAHRRLLPMLDGLDEMSTESRVRALSAINDLPPSAPLVLTCRTAEYSEAVLAGGALRAAPVVELEPVGVDAALAWLRADSPPIANAVQARIEADGVGGPLSQALTTPLMVFLVRGVYQSLERDPAELADRVRFPDQAAIERHLLAQYVPVVFTKNRRRRRPSGRSGYTVPASFQERAPVPWSPDRAVAWLAFLADHLARRRDDDLSWWRLRHRSSAVGAVMAGTVGIIAGLAFGTEAGTDYGLAAGLRHGCAYGLVFAVMFGVCQALVRQHHSEVGARTRRMPWGLPMGFTRVAAGLAAGVVGGIFAGLAGAVLGSSVGFAVLGLLVGLASTMLVDSARQAAGHPTGALRPLSILFDGLVLGLGSWPAALLVLGFAQGATWQLYDGSAGNLLASYAVELHAGLLFGSFLQLRGCLLFGLAFGLMCTVVGWLAGQVDQIVPLASEQGGSGRARWATGLAVLSGALSGGLLGGLILGLAGDPVAGIAGGLGYGAAVALLRHRQERPGGSGLGDPILLNAAGRTTAGALGGIVGGLLGGGFSGGVLFHFHFTGRPAGGVVETLAVGLVAGLRGGIGVGVAFGLLFGLAGVAVGRPVRLSLQIRGRARALLLRLAGGLAAGIAAAVVLTVAFPLGLGAGQTAALGLLGGVVAGLGSWLLAQPPEIRAAGPDSTLRADRTVTLAGGVVGGAVAGAVVAMATQQAVLGLMAVPILAVTVAWGTSWTGFSITRARLATLRRTPWRLMTFLDDTRHLGILRQVGPVYQFRHTRLREQLAQRDSRSVTATSSTR